MRDTTAWMWNRRYAGLMSIVFTSVVLTSTALQDMWLGPIPGWLLALALAAGLTLVHPPLQRALGHVSNALRDPAVLPWLACVFIALMLDGFRGSLSFGKTTLLNLLQLGALLFVAALAFLTPPRLFIYLIAFVAAVEGIICIGQILQIQAAWHLPEIYSKYSEGGSNDRIGSAGLGFGAIVLRVKGTVLYIHKFNPMQGMFAAIVATMALTGPEVAEALRIRRGVLVFAGVLGLIGVLLTFSRSTWGGLGAVLLLLLLKSNLKISPVRIVVLVAVLGAIIWATSFSPVFTRLLNFDTASYENAARVSQLGYASEVFDSFPLIGNPQSDDPKVLPIHSVLLRQFVDYGVFGFISYLALILGLLTVSYRYSQSRDAVISALGSAALASLVVALFDAWTHSSGLLRNDVTQAVLLGALLGLAMGYSARRKAMLSLPAAEAVAFPLPAADLPAPQPG